MRRSVKICGASRNKGLRTNGAVASEAVHPFLLFPPPASPLRVELSQPARQIPAVALADVGSPVHLRYEAKIAELDATRVSRDVDVVRLDVEVCHPAGMEVPQSRRDLAPRGRQQDEVK